MATLNGLHPYVKDKAEKLLANANARLKSHKMIITQALRTMEQQAAIYGQGRTSYIYNGKQYGNPNKPVVSNAKPGSSMHNYGLAVDFALVTPDGRTAIWNTTADFDKDGKADWMEVVEEAKKLGFEWGGDWKGFVDYPHFQISGGLRPSELAAGKKPVFPKSEPTPKPVEPKPVAPKPVPKPVVKEEDDMLKVAIVMGSQADFPASESLAVRLKAPIYLRNAIIGEVAKHLIIVGGDAKGLKADKITDLSGTTRFDTSDNVRDYIKKL